MFVTTLSRVWVVEKKQYEPDSFYETRKMRESFIKKYPSALFLYVVKII